MVIEIIGTYPPDSLFCGRADMEAIMDVMGLIIWLAIIVIAVVVIWFLFSQMSLPEPIQKIVMIVAVVIFAVLAIGFLLSLRGGLHLSQRSMIVDPEPLLATVESVRQDFKTVAPPALALANSRFRFKPNVEPEPA